MDLSIKISVCKKSDALITSITFSKPICWQILSRHNFFVPHILTIQYIFQRFYCSWSGVLQYNCVGICLFKTWIEHALKNLTVITQKEFIEGKFFTIHLELDNSCLSSFRKMENNSRWEFSWESIWFITFSVGMKCTLKLAWKKLNLPLGKFKTK